MTPTDTNPSGVHTPHNPNDPCACGHSRRNHGHDNGRGVCFVCTHPAGGCRGFTPDRPDSTAATRDAYLAGFTMGAHWEAGDKQGHPMIFAERAYREWVEGPGEDA